jgi:hypothetical protein
MTEQTFIETDQGQWLELEQFPGTKLLPLAEPLTCYANKIASLDRRSAGFDVSSAERAQGRGFYKEPKISNYAI